MNKTLSALHWPALLWLRRFRLSTQIAMIGALALVPLLGLTSLWLGQQNEQLAFARNERAGAQVVSALLEVAVHAQTHRGQTNLLLSGNEAMRDKLPPTREKLRSALAHADALLASQTAWGLAPAWQPVRQALAQLAQGEHGTQRAAVFAQHSQQIAALRRLMQDVGDRSQLVFDPEAGSYYMAEMAVERLLPWSETLGQMRGQGAGLLARHEASSDELAQVMVRAGQLDDQVNGIATKIAAMERAGLRAPAAWQTAREASEAFLKATRAAFENGAPEGESAPYFAAGTQAIEAVVGFNHALGDRLVTMLQQREQAIGADRLLYGSLALACALTLFLFIGLFLGQVNQTMASVGKSMQAVALGDLTVPVDSEGRDELADMARQVNTMRARLSELVHRIQGHAREVASGGDVLMNDSRELATRTTQQAAGVEQSASTLEQVAGTVRSNGQQVQGVAALFDTMKHTVDEGSLKMREAVRTIESVEQTSQRVADIVTVIDGIAFQTNILSLNAAVEAARAGESGRGFAVVAAEVRSLAQRCSQAAAEVRQLIAESVEQVARGADEVRQASGSLDALLARVADVHGALAGVNQATQEQTVAVDQVSAAVREMGNVTQRNAESVERAGRLAAELEAQARALMDAVAEMKPDAVHPLHAALPAPALA